MSIQKATRPGREIKPVPSPLQRRAGISEEALPAGITAESLLAAGETRSIPIGELTSDPGSYQRPIDPRIVGRIQRQFKAAALGVITVNQRPSGQLVIVDGQHRVDACHHLFPGSFRVECRVLTLATIAEEAAVARIINECHTRTTHRELFRMRLTEGDPSAQEISRAVGEAGFCLKLEAGSGTALDCSQTATLERIYQAKGGVGLRQVLTFVKEVWGNQPGSLTGQFLQGSYQFLHEFGHVPAFRWNEVIARLQRYGVTEVRRLQKEMALKTGRSADRAFALALQELYNKHTGTGRRKLYAATETA